MRPPLWSFQFDSGAVLTVIAAGAVVAAWRRGGGLPAGQGRRGAVLALGAAVVVLLVAFVSPLATLARWYLAAAHVLQLALTMTVAAPLLVLSLPPDRKEGDATGQYPGPMASRITRLRLRAGRWARWRYALPAAGLLLFNAVFFLWQTSALVDLARRSEAVYAAEQATLLIVAVTFWLPIARPGGSGLHPLARLAYIAVALIPQTFVGMTLAMAQHVIYTGYGDGPAAVGWDAMTDQALAGVTMALLTKATLLVAFFVILGGLLSEEDDPLWGDDDGGLDVETPGPPPPGPAVPRWYRTLTYNVTVDEPAPRKRTTRQRAEKSSTRRPRALRAREP